MIFMSEEDLLNSNKNLKVIYVKKSPVTSKSQEYFAYV